MVDPRAKGSVSSPTTMARIFRLLLVESTLPDIQLAVGAAQSVGITQIETQTTLDAGLSALERGLREEHSLPDIILVDLELGLDSGYELMRYWRSSPRLAQIPLLAWSRLSDQHRGLSAVFKVTEYVSKWDGPEALKAALLRIKEKHNSGPVESA